VEVSLRSQIATSKPVLVIATEVHGFDIAKYDIKGARRSAETAACLHEAQSHHGGERVEQLIFPKFPARGKHG